MSSARSGVSAANVDLLEILCKTCLLLTSCSLGGHLNQAQSSQFREGRKRMPAKLGTYASPFFLDDMQ